jgi:hypothetical protein
MGMTPRIKFTAIAATPRKMDCQEWKRTNELRLYGSMAKKMIAGNDGDISNRTGGGLRQPALLSRYRSSGGACRCIRAAVRTKCRVAPCLGIAGWAKHGMRSLANVICGGFAPDPSVLKSRDWRFRKKKGSLFSSPISMSWSGFVAAGGPISRWLIAYHLPLASVTVKLVPKCLFRAGKVNCSHRLLKRHQ